MAYPLNSNDIVLVQVRYAQLNVTEMINTLHYRVISPSITADGGAALLTLAQHIANDALATTWAARWRNIAANDTVLDRVIAQKIWPQRFITSVADVAINGALPEQSVPQVVQWSISRRGDISGAGRVGGVRVPGLPESFVTFGQLAVAAQVPAANLAEILRQDISTVAPTVTYRPIIFNRTTPAESPDVTAVQVHQDVRSQRTRIVFRGI